MTFFEDVSADVSWGTMGLSGKKRGRRRAWQGGSSERAENRGDKVKKKEERTSKAPSHLICSALVPRTRALSYLVRYLVVILSRLGPWPGPSAVGSVTTSTSVPAPGAPAPPAPGAPPAPPSSPCSPSPPPSRFCFLFRFFFWFLGGVKRQTLLSFSAPMPDALRGAL